MGLNSSTIEDWLSARRLENTEITVRGDRTAAEHYLEWANANGVMIPFAGQGDFNRYADFCKAKLKPHAIYQRIKMLRNLYRHLYKNHWHAYRNPTIAWKLDTTGLPTGHRGQHKPVPLEIEILTVGQVETCFEQAEAALVGLSEDRRAVHARRIAIAEVIYSAGLTPTDALGLRRQQFDGEYAGALEIGEANDRRHVPLTPSAYAAMKKWLSIASDLAAPNHGSAFFSVPSGAALDRSGISKDLVFLGNLVRPTKDPELNATNLRHSFAAHLLINQADPGLVAYVLGNGSMDVVSRVLKAAQLLVGAAVAAE
jgi:site-specific recombinase XerD